MTAAVTTIRLHQPAYLSSQSFNTHQRSLPLNITSFSGLPPPALLFLVAFVVLALLPLAPLALLLAGRRGRACILFLARFLAVIFVLFLARFLAVTPVFAAQLGASDPNWARSTFRAAPIVQGVQLIVAHSIVLFSNAVVLVGLAE